MIKMVQTPEPFSWTGNGDHNARVKLSF